MSALVLMAPVGKSPSLFMALYFLGHILMVLMVWCLPTQLSSRRVFGIVFVLGISSRLIFLRYPASNDVFRYVWEGYIQNHGFNPYRWAPVSPVLANLARGDLYPIWQQINHPEFAAAYPPAALLMFRILAWIDPDPFFFKAVMVAVDIGVMLVLTAIIRHRGTPPARLLLYAANPLILLYISGEGHLDVVQIFFLSLALYLILCKKYQITGFWVLGLAILSKYFALVAFPFLVNAENRWRSLAVLIPLALYIPFIDAGGHIFQSLGKFGAGFHYNDSVTVLVRFLFGNHHVFVAVFLLAVCLLWVYVFVHEPLRSVYLALGCLLVLLPTLHPWYLSVIVPILIFFPSRAWLYLCAAVGLTFPVIAGEYNTGIFQEISWLKLIEYIPFYGLLLYGICRDGFLLPNHSYGRPRWISVVVPTLNEAGNLVRCLKSLKGRTALKEIIVADGGSNDGTPALAAQLGARVLECRRGRGLQIQSGIQAASGDVIVIMHADCAAGVGVFQRIIEKLGSDPGIAGGAVGMQFEQATFRTALIAFLNNSRAFLTGISFGDQAQYFRVEALAAAGGFPSMMLMEDVEVSLRLKESGRLIFLRNGVVVSSRRWQGSAFTGNLMTVFYLFTRYLAWRRFSRNDELKQNYYDAYYSEKKPNSSG